MLFDALTAESFKFTRNRVAVFWSLLFLPIMVVVSGIAQGWVMRSRVHQLNEALTPPGGTEPMINLAGAGSPVNLAGSMLTHSGELASAMVILFALIGITSIWASDYRFETWRLIIARNSRSNLLWGKVAVAGMLVIGVMALVLLTNVISGVIQAGFMARPVAFNMSGQEAGATLGLFGLNWLRLMQVAGLGLLTAIVTRSLLATLFVPLVLTVAQAALPGILMGMGVGPDSWTSLLLSPGQGVTFLGGLIASDGIMQQFSSTVGYKSVLGLALWLLLPFAGAFLLFQRQDLSKE
ncbi:MAG: hypothetical protein HZY74_05995 [Brevundimonas sp.]|nr:MAG: hypothetical protein HZY74_05995 [Brevundimonas sp.]